MKKKEKVHICRKCQGEKQRIKEIYLWPEWIIKEAKDLSKKDEKLEQVLFCPQCQEYTLIIGFEVLS